LRNITKGISRLKLAVFKKYHLHHNLLLVFIALLKKLAVE
jgi:hypothetical protein